MNKRKLSLTQDKNIPLCVDLDGTLIATDTLIESIASIMKSNPLLFLLFPFWLAKGLPFFKSKVYSNSKVNYSNLPIQDKVVEYIQNAKDNGRKAYLVTASYKSIAQKVCENIDLFDEIIGSDETINLKGKNKRNNLIELFGEKQFDYIGDHVADFPVWDCSNKAVVVAKRKSVVDKAKRIYANIDIIESKQFSLILFVKEIRIYQWIKNLLIFIPFLLAHHFRNIEAIQTTLLAFVAFSLTASSVYLVNDIFDLESDRKHLRKRNRPLASGAMPLLYGIIAAPLFLITGFLISFLFLNIEFQITLLVYFIITIAYSFTLKRIPLIDILVLSLLYTIRVIAGGAASITEISPWLLAFSMFIFLSLAILKRYTELLTMKNENKVTAAGRGYHVEDMNLLLSIGPSSGLFSILVFALYINSKEVIALYHHTLYLWLILPLLIYSIMKLWFAANRGDMTDDPIIYFAKDKSSYIIILLIMLLAYFAI